VVAFTIGSRGEVPGKGKTCDKRRNNNNNNNNHMCTAQSQVNILVLMPSEIRRVICKECRRIKCISFLHYAMYCVFKEDWK
jgi:hypothetical protein